MTRLLLTKTHLERLVGEARDSEKLQSYLPHGACSPHTLKVSENKLNFRSMNKGEVIPTYTWLNFTVSVSFLSLCKLAAAKFKII